jgi:hypothetical protein
MYIHIYIYVYIISIQNSTMHIRISHELNIKKPEWYLCIGLTTYFKCMIAFYAEIIYTYIYIYISDSFFSCLQKKKTVGNNSVFLCG